MHDLMIENARVIDGLGGRAVIGHVKKTTGGIDRQRARVVARSENLNTGHDGICIYEREWTGPGVDSVGRDGAAGEAGHVSEASGGVERVPPALIAVTLVCMLLLKLVAYATRPARSIVTEKGIATEKSSVMRDSVPSTLMA